MQQKLRTTAYIIALIFTIIGGIAGITFITLKLLYDGGVVRIPAFPTYTDTDMHKFMNTLFMDGCYLTIMLFAGIPLTIAIKGTIDDRAPHIAIGVCTLLFLGLIPGIIYLVSSSSSYEKTSVRRKTNTKKRITAKTKKK